MREAESTSPTRSPVTQRTTLSEQPIAFVCGLHRSGTSPLSRALAAHPEVSGFSGTDRPGEGQFRQNVYPTAEGHGGPGRFGFDSRAHLTEDSPLVTQENRAQLFAEWARYWDRTKSVLVEKSPPNLLKTRFLQALFPEAVFVVIVRHPVAVTMATKKLWGGSEETLIEHWLRCHEIFMADAPLLRRPIVVRYEELIGNRRLFPEIVAALEVRPTADLGAYVKRGLNEAYFEQWQPDEELREPLENRFERGVNRFGYSLVEPTRSVAPAPDFERLLSDWRSHARRAFTDRCST